MDLIFYYYDNGKLSECGNLNVETFVLFELGCLFTKISLANYKISSDLVCVGFSLSLYTIACSTLLVGDWFFPWEFNNPTDKITSTYTFISWHHNFEPQHHICFNIYYKDKRKLS